MSQNKIYTMGILVIVIVGLYFFLSKPPGSQKTIQTNPQLQITPTTTQSMEKLKIEDITIGTGQEAKSGDTVVMNYLGTLVDGTKFDSSYDRQQTFETKIGVGQVIKGWDEGVPGMKVGGKRKLTIPPELGYGASGAGNVIPPNATLVFEVELVGIK